MSLNKNIVANYLGQGWTALVGLAFVPLYIKYLGIEAYGLIGMFAVMQAWLGLLDLGVTPTLGREMARFTAGAHSAQSIRDLLRSLETIYCCLAVFIALGVWLGSDYLAGGLLKTEKLAPVLVADIISIMGFVIALRFCEGIYRSSLIGLQKQVWYNWANAVLSTLRHGGAVFVLIFIAPTLEAFFYWQAIISLVSLAVFVFTINISLPKAPTRACFKYQSIRDVWGFSSGVFLAGLLALVLNLSDKTLLAGLVSLDAYGYYTLAASITALLFMLTTPVVQAVYPHLVEHITKNDTETMFGNYHKAARLITLLTATPALLITFNSWEVIFIWTGNAKIADSTSGILSVLSLGSLLNCILYLPNHLQLAHGWVKQVIKINIVFLAAYLPAIFLAVPSYGALGVAFIWLALNLIRFVAVPNMLFSELYPAHKKNWYLQDVLKPIGVVLLPLVLMLLVKPYFAKSFLIIFLYFGLAAVLILLSILWCYPDYRSTLRYRLNRD